MWINSLLMAVIGLSAGFTVAAGLGAFMIELGVISDFADRTHTGEHVLLCNLYPVIAKWAGAGALVPITGFANSVAAPAIEYQKEGQVMGIGCKIFTIAGPVILYGTFISWLLGLGYWILKICGIL